jgi:hypothetical protein
MRLSLWKSDEVQLTIEPKGTIRMASQPQLPTCAYFGPTAGDEPPPSRPLPPDYATQPLKYLPPTIALSPEELELADRYEKEDFSGGYLASQIAYFRRGPSLEEQRQRREKFQGLHAEINRLGLVLPDAYVELIKSDEFMRRLRHNTIWLQLPDEIVPLPSAPEHKLFLIAVEGQGCSYWHLLLSPDGGHIVTTSGHPFGLSGMFPGGGGPDIADCEVYQCAASFEEWIVSYFVECVAEDRHYEEMLKAHPGM